MLKIAIAGLGALGKRWTEVVDNRPASSAETTVHLSALVDPLVGSEQEPSWLKDRREALLQGCDVLVEKPFATNLDDAGSLVQLAAERDRILMVSQNYRFFPGPQMVRKLVASGEFGSIRAVAGQFWCDWPGKPYQHAMLHPMSLEMAIHHFDVVRFMFSAEAVSGWVHEWNPSRSPYRMGGALEALFVMASSESSFPFNYTGSLVTTAPAIPWGGFWRFEFDEATLVADDLNGDYALYRSSPSGRVRISDFGDPTMGFDKSFQHFLDCIVNRTEPLCSGRDNLNSLRMALNFQCASAAPQSW